MAGGVTATCKNCEVSFLGRVWKGALPQFCSSECHNTFRRKPKQIKKRFWSYVDIGSEEECWLWKGANHSSGYGYFNYTRKSGNPENIYAHRFAYRVTRGKIPKDIFVCHRCDTPLCCNPGHLFLGTPADNMQDKVSKNRQSRTKGEEHGPAKLTESDVYNILRLRREGYTQQTIADMYGIHRANVSLICSGKSWKHLENPT